MERRKTFRPFTYEDLRRLPDDNLRHEILDGVHVESPAPAVRHQRILGRLHLLIGGYMRRRPLGEVLFAPTDVVLSKINVLEPDLLFVARERSAVVTEACLSAAPDVAVEILSPSTRHRDREIKREIYERFGTGEYWIVDPEEETIEVLHLEGDRFQPARELAARRGDVLRSPFLPGLEMPLAEIFSDPPA